MKISSLLHQFNPDLEDKKRSLQRKDAGEAYKKHAKYADASKNPMLQALENLLSGKTEKELHEADAAARKDSEQSSVEMKEPFFELPEVKKEIERLKQTEKEISVLEHAHKAAGAGVTGAITYTQTTVPENQRSINGSGESNETIALLENVRQAALAPAEPSLQDFRVAASASAQIQQARGEQIDEPFNLEDEEEIAPFANEDFSFEVPERFKKNFVRNAEEQTVFGQELEKLLFQRTFNKASEKYGSHTAMVSNGYRPMYEPTFSQSA